jgi:hypothetical protein
MPTDSYKFDVITRPSAVEKDKDGNIYWNKNHVSIVIDEDGKEVHICKFLTGLSNKPEIIKYTKFGDIHISDILRRDVVFLKKSLLNSLNTCLGNRNVIIGLGPGRCGTMSLATLLAYQEQIIAHHESKPRLGWHATVYEFIGKWARLFSEIAYYAPIVADVAFWYLPHVASILAVCPNTKFVCLRRNVEEVVNSFMLKYPYTSAWTFSDSEHWHKEWDSRHGFIGAFPQYDLPKKDGCRRYVTEYYATCEDYAEQMPNNFRIFDIDMLNTKEGVRSILEFCGLSGESVVRDDSNICVHTNRTVGKHKDLVRKFKDEFGEDF